MCAVMSSLYGISHAALASREFDIRAAQPREHTRERLAGQNVRAAARASL